MSIATLLSAYDDACRSLDARGRELEAEIASLTRRAAIKVQSVTSRIKDRESLARKLARPDRRYPDLWTVTDLIGIRVVTYFADDVDRVGALIEAELAVDFEHSIDKRRQRVTEFGYRSLHYVCCSGGALPARARYEIQVRSVLDHAWAEIEHDLGYKASEEIPTPVRRRLSRLAGLLELADHEFVAIRSELARYAQALPERIESANANVPLDRLSLSALLECAEVKALDARIAKTLSKDLGEEPFYPDYLLKMLVASGVQTTDQARRGVRVHERAIAAMAAPYFAATEQLWRLTPREMKPFPRGYSLFFLAHALVLLSSTLRLERIERLAHLYRALDYPDDPKTAHAVATVLFEAIADPPLSCSA